MGRDESGVHSADIDPRIGAAHPRETAGFQRSLLAALTPSPLMSALWTPGRAGARVRGSCGSARRLRHRSARPTSDRRLCWGLEAMTRRRLRLESRLLHEGRDPLNKGCAHCTRAPPTQSAPHPRPVTPAPRAVPPDDDGSHHSDLGTPLRQTEATARPTGRRTPPVS